MRRTLELTVPLLSLTLAACGGAEGGHAKSAREPVANNGTSKPPFHFPAEGDRTAAFRYSALGAPWGAKIITATESEPGRLEVRIRLADPREGNGSLKTQRAIIICRAAVRFLLDDGAKKPRVKVMERNGTLWVRTVRFGLPGDPDRCIEV
jgi:hypothetical protein